MRKEYCSKCGQYFDWEEDTTHKRYCNGGECGRMSNEQFKSEKQKDADFLGRYGRFRRDGE